MVELCGPRRWFALVLLLALALPSSWAQNYDINDTVTEYPMKGTFYHNRFEGRKTASGEIFNQNLFTAAHWKIKLGTYVLVTNQNTGLQVIVKVNDRCPRRGVIDMTRRAAHSIGIKGSQPVTVRILAGDYEEICEAQDSRFDSVPSMLSSDDTPPQIAFSSSKQKKKENQVLTPNNDSNDEVVEVQKKINVPPPKMPEQFYSLPLGVAHSHGEAFEIINQLPDIYKDKAVIDSSSEDYFIIILDVRLPLKKAKELSRALKHTFNDCHLTPVE